MRNIGGAGGAGGTAFRLEPAHQDVASARINIVRAASSAIIHARRFGQSHA